MHDVQKKQGDLSLKNFDDLGFKVARDLAVATSRLEGGEDNQQIAQISETIRCLCVVLERRAEASKCFARYRRAVRRVLEIGGEITG